MDTRSGEVSRPRFASAAVQTLGTQLGLALLSFGSVLIVARTLGAAGRGEVAFLTTIAVLCSTLGLLGIDDANVNLAGREPARRRALATNSLILSALIGVALAAVLIPLTSAYPGLAGNAASGLRGLAVAAIPVIILKTTLKFLLQADFRFAVSNAVWMMPPLLTFLANAVLAVTGHLTVAASFTAWVSAHVLATALLVGYVALRSTGFGRPDVAVARQTLHFGGRSHVGRVMMVGNYRLDQWLVGAIAGNRELGLYSVAVSLAEVLFYLPTALTIAQRPYLVRAAKPDAGRRAARAFRASATLTLVAAAGLALIAPIVMPPLFGDEFRDSVHQLQILVVGAVGILALKLLGNALTAQQRPGLATAGAAAAFVTTLTLDAVLIPLLGGTGAAIASAGAYVAGGLATAIIFMRFFGIGASSLRPRIRDVPDLVRTVRPVSRA
jgi:O-antigen/teichoic acid export membrane protein